MVIPTFLFYELVVGLGVLAGAVGILAYVHSQTLHKLRKVEKEKEELEKHSGTRAEHLVERARDKAHDILEDANAKAGTTLTQALVFTDHESHLLQEELVKTSEEIKSHYKMLMEQIKKDTINTFQNVSKGIEQESLAELDDFKKMLQEETVAAQKIIGQKLEQEYEGMRGELQTYKASELQKIDQSIYKLLRTVSEMVIGKALNLEEQQKLVLDSLEKAKTDMTKT